MALLKYKTLSFWEEPSQVRANLNKRFFFYLDKQELKKIAPFKVTSNQLEFDCSQERAERRFTTLLDAKITNLHAVGTKNQAVYIHKNSNIPLTGSLSFGLIHRGTSIIEVKPQTTCNLDCIYCSVNEGLSSDQTDYLVERAYLLEEFKKLAKFLNTSVEAHIGVQGEPLAYAEFTDLVDDLSNLKEVHQISTDTNGTYLSKPLIDKLSKYKKLRLNISLNTIDRETASKMAGAPYNTEHVMNMIRYAAKKHLDFLIAPLFVPGYNDDKIVDVIKFAQTLPNKPTIGIQNFMNYKTGRNPVKAFTWEQFITKLRGLEKQTGERLILDFKKDFNITETKQLPKPFKKGNTIKANIVAPGRYPKTRLAVAKDRVITVFQCEQPLNKEIKIKILRSKHNIFFGKEIGK
jgi:uncharacterized protein